MDTIHISAAKVTGDCGLNGDECKFKELVRVSVNNGDYGGSRCPKPSIALDFKCNTHTTSRFRNMDDVFSQYEWQKSRFYGRRSGLEYRVIPPQKTKSKKKKGDEGTQNEEEFKDPFDCTFFYDDKKLASAKDRPRFQIKQTNGKITTCCIRKIVPGHGQSIPYYWPGQLQINGEDTGAELDGEGGGGGSVSKSNSAAQNAQNPRLWNEIPESAIGLLSMS